MTDAEHLLLVMMFTRQSQYIAVLEDVLVSKEIISREDLPAFDFAARTDRLSIEKALLGTKEQYRSFADEVGVKLPDMS